MRGKNRIFISKINLKFIEPQGQTLSLLDKEKSNQTKKAIHKYLHYVTRKLISVTKGTILKVNNLISRSSTLNAKEEHKIKLQKTWTSRRREHP